MNHIALHPIIQNQTVLYNCVLQETWRMMHPLASFLLPSKFAKLLDLRMKIALLCKFDQLPTSCQCTSSLSLVWAPLTCKCTQDRKEQHYCKNRRCNDIALTILQLCCLYWLVKWYRLLDFPIDQDLLRLSTQWCWKNWTGAILKIHCAIAKAKVLVKDLDRWLLKKCLLNPR